MSLINEMLKDLEARGGTDRIAADVRSTVQPARRGDRRHLLHALGALVVALALAVAWLAFKSAREVAPVPSAQVTARPAADTGETASTAVPPASPAAVPVKAEAEIPASTGAPDPVVLPQETEQVARETAPVVAPPEPASTTVPVTAAADDKPKAPEGADDLIVRRHEPTDAQKAARASREGFAALRRQDWALAARMLGELVVLEPTNDDAREGLVIALSNQGRLAEADGVLLDGLALGVTPARFAKLRARLLASQGRLADALQSLAVAVPPVADDPEFHALRGALAQQAGEYALALGTYRALVSFAPANGTWQAGLGMALDQSGEAAAALDAYRRAYAAGGLEPALLEHVQKRLASLSGGNE